LGVAGGRVGVGVESAAARGEGPVDLGREPQGDVVVGPGQVVEAVGPGLQIAAPPLPEPDLGAADGGADGLDGPAGEAQGNGAMTSSQFVDAVELIPPTIDLTVEPIHAMADAIIFCQLRVHL